MNLFVLLWSFFSMSMPPHAFYVSVVDIAYEESSGELGVKIKLFANDLEDGIRASQQKIIKLQDGVSSTEASVVHSYLLSKVELLLDGKPAPLSMISCKQEGDAVFSIYEGKVPFSPKKLEIKNSILIELFPTQKNIVRLKAKGAQGLLKLDKQNQTGELSF
ncbi:MAG: DUF6702 family protein [Bacteroidota bacterium]